MKFEPTLEDTLISRFEGEFSEMEDIVTHGISGGYHGFIYTYEVNSFFDEFENELEDYFYDVFGDTWLQETGCSTKSSFSEMKCHLVYMYVEMWCETKLDELALCAC